MWLIRRHRGKLKNEYSHFSTEELSWLSELTFAVAASWGWTLLVHIVARFSSDITADYLGIAGNYITFILVNAFFAYP